MHSVATCYDDVTRYWLIDYTHLIDGLNFRHVWLFFADVTICLLEA
jgi:hypothetical protein